MSDQSQLDNRELQLYIDVIQKVKDFGFMQMGIFPTEDDPNYKGFGYTVGLAIHGGYEFAVGGLSAATQSSFFHTIHQKLLDGWRPVDNGIDTDIANFPCRLQLMTDDHACNMSRWYWSEGEAPFQVMQIVWGDKNGILPGEPGFDGDRFIEVQQIEGSTL